MLFISVGMGSLLFAIAKPKNLVFLILSGLFFQLLLIHFWGLFFATSTVFYAFNSGFSASLILVYRKEIRILFKQSFKDFQNWRTFTKLIFGLIGIAALMQSSVSPYLPDNESYYIQSIRWVNEYGLVKGLANIHPFFGQMSGWHLLQSSFNFGFWVDFLNDLNGFLLVVVAFFGFDRLNHFSKERNLPDLFIGFIFITSIFLFRFLDAPSPDLPVYLIFPLMVWIFINEFEKPSKEYIFLLFIFGLLLVLSKISSFPVLMLPIVLLFKSREFKKAFPIVFMLCITALTAFCSKNYIITGYLLYPSNWLGELVNPDWKMPGQLQQLYYDYTQFHAFNSPETELEDFKNWSPLTKFQKWVFSPKLHGFFNQLILALLITFPLWIRKNKAFFWIYLTGFCQFMILYFTSPQYRFFFHIILVLGLIVVSLQIQQFRLRKLKSMLLFSIILVFVPLTFNINFKAFTNNKFMRTTTKTFKISYLLKPHKNSQYKYKYKEITEGNFKYNSPVNTHLWLTGDGQLPAVNQLMVNFFKEEIQLRPQLRSERIKDGFISLKTEE